MTIPARLVLMCALLALPAAAQEGHPLSGTWSGERTVAGKAIRVTLVMEWDGKAITGRFNPGPDAIPLQRVTVDYDKWTVRIEAKGTVVEGKLDDLGSWHRTLTGTWADGTGKSPLKLTRD